MRFAWLSGGAVVGACLAASACSTSKSDRTGSIAQAIQGGEEDSVHRYAVGLCRGNAPAACNSLCSGALILPNLVATARHCVSQSPAIVDCKVDPQFGAAKAGGLFITTNLKMDVGGAVGWYGVQPGGVYVPDDDHICGNDIALIILSKSVPAAETKPITPGVQYVMWDPIPGYVPVYTAIGYGNSDTTSGSGTRRKRELISVLCIPGSDDRPCPADFNAKEFAGGDATCSGDSGSSAYEATTFDRGEPVSLGVLSRGAEDDSTCKGAAYTRFDAHRDFVLKVAKIASANWTNYPEPDWTTPKPAPVSKKDPTADKDSGATPSGLAIGEPCAAKSECANKLCVDPGDGALICSKSCSSSTPTSCPADYECRESLCLPAAAPVAPPAPTVTKTSGCSTTPSSPSSASWGFLGVGIAAAAFGLRRRTR